MTINERAKAHYDNACEFQQSALDAPTFEEKMTFTNLGELSVKLAQFCVDNHALVAGIDEELSHPDSVREGARPWGGPPLPDHVRASLAALQESRRIHDG